MKGDGDFRWYYGIHEDEWHEAESYEDAIECGKEAYDNEVSFRICLADMAELDDEIFNAGNVLEDFFHKNEEIAPDFLPSATEQDALEQMLTDTFHKWRTTVAHIRGAYFGEMRAEETIYIETD